MKRSCEESTQLAISCSYAKLGCREPVRPTSPRLQHGGRTRSHRRSCQADEDYKEIKATVDAALEKRACRTRWLLLLLRTNRLHSPIQQQTDGKNSGLRHLCRRRHWGRPSAIRGNAYSCPWDLWIYRLWRHTSGFGLSKSISLDGCSSF